MLEHSSGLEIKTGSRGQLNFFWLTLKYVIQCLCNATGGVGVDLRNHRHAARGVQIDTLLFILAGRLH